MEDMINPLYEKLARLVVKYSLRVKKGQRIRIWGPSIAKELFQALYKETVIAGGYPWIDAHIEGMEEIFLKYASDEQLLYVDNLLKQMYNEFNGFISVHSDYNTRKLSLIKPEVIAKFRGSPDRKELRKIFEERFTKGALNWVVVPFPSHSLAQEANMDIFSYTDFVEKALFLDKDDPVMEWQKLEKEQARIIKHLNKVEHIKVLGEDTDLTFSVKGRRWINCCGLNNLPDGEVFTCPVEDSVNGDIKFTYPGIYSGNEVENIYFEFKDGEVTNATADKGEELLKELLEIENARRLGEFAIGTNYGITKFTKNILFDEKIGGTIHCAIGESIKIAGGKNLCAIHWDILKDMKVAGSQIIADGKIIYEEGNWKI
jgi:aminopeptidase